MTVNSEWIKRSAQLSHEVYERVADALQDSEVLITDDDVVALLAFEDDVTYITFKGTDNVLGWATNLDFTQFHSFVDGQEIKRHGGYLKSVVGVYGRVVNAIKNKGNGNPVVVGGHSKGGGEAGVFALQYQFLQTHAKYGNIAGLVTLGAPRFTDQAGAKILDKHFGKSAIRFVNGHDIVPHIIPAELGKYEYCHAGVLCHLEDGGMSAPMLADIFPNPSSINNTLWSGLIAIAEPAIEKLLDCDVTPDSIRDHDSAKYAELVANHYV